MSSEVEIQLTAIDQASAVVNQVAENIQTADSQITESTNAASNATQQAGQSTQQTALGFNNLATSGMSLYMAIDRVENSQVALDRAHLGVEKATNAVTAAQTHYNDACAKYGPNSKEAQDALAKLQTAQEGLQVAQERSDMAQRNYNNTLIFSAMTVVPSLITAFTSITTIGPAVSGAVEAIGGAMDFLAANPVVLIIAGIAALVMGLIYAYENCKPFRDAINEIGIVLGGAVMTAVNAVRTGLTWLWQNVLAPIGTFLAKDLSANIVAVGGIIQWLWTDCFQFLENGLIWLWDHVLKPLADFVGNTFKGALDAVGSVVKTVSGFFGGLTSALGSLCFVHATPAAQEFNKTITDTIGLTDTLSGKLGGLTSGLTGVAGGVSGPSPIGGIAAAATRAPITVTISAPLVQVQGSADMDTARLAAQLVQDKLKNVLVEASSHGALESHKRVRIGWNG
jgi:hypothetical protein